VYDANQRLCQTINPEFGTTIVDYDVAGNLWWSAEGQTASGTTAASCAGDRASTAAGARTTRTINSMNRVTYLATPGGDGDIATTYEPDGLIKSLTALSAYSGAQVVTDYRYKPTPPADCRRLLAAWLVPDHDRLWIRSKWQRCVSYLSGYAAGRVRARRAWPANAGGVVCHGYQLSPEWRYQELCLWNGVAHQMVQNVRRLPSRSSDWLGSVVAIDDYIYYDNNGNTAEVHDGAQAGLTYRAMAYDGLDRLTSAWSPNQWGSATYTYDPIDNIRSTDIGGAAARQYRYNYYGNKRSGQYHHPGRRYRFQFHLRCSWELVHKE
jgi:hypothetical protein